MVVNDLSNMLPIFYGILIFIAGYLMGIINEKINKRADEILEDLKRFR